jgi:hypothetical protein
MYSFYINHIAIAIEKVPPNVRAAAATATAVSEAGQDGNTSSPMSQEYLVMP